jgi:hypothetical protein
MDRDCSTNGKKRNTYRILVGKEGKERDHKKVQHVGEWVILRWILRQDGVVWSGLIWFRIGTSRWPL